MHQVILIPPPKGKKHMLVATALERNTISSFGLCKLDLAIYMHWT